MAEIRANEEPQFLELVTYCQRGYFEPDEQSYVNAVELQQWQQRDPILLFKSRLH